jgi:glycosyltransferase involved in cell wall biosynthesis
MQKNIVICVQYRIDHDLVGGMDRYCWAMDETLKKMGIRPKWFFPKSDFTLHYREKDIEIVFIDHKDFLQGVYQYFVEFDLHPDIMLTHFTRYFTKEMGWFKKHGVGEIISFEHLFRDLKARSFALKVKTLIKGALYYKYPDRVAFVSEYVYRQALEEYWLIRSLIHKKIEVVYNGIDSDVYSIRHAHADNKYLRAVCACRIVEAKGLHILIDAVEQLEKTGYLGKFMFDIYGEGQDKELFIKLINEKHIKGIVFLNNANNLNELMPDYDLAIFPTFGEAHPFFVLESFACELPIIASNVGGIPEMVSNERGFLITPGSTEELKDAIIHCIENRTQLPAMGKKCREYVLSNFTINHMIKRHLKILGLDVNSVTEQ